MKRLMVCALGGIGLAGCAAMTSPSFTEASSLAWGNSGSIFGGQQTTLHSDDRYVVRNQRADGQVIVTEFQAPEGSFESLVLITAQNLSRLPETSDVIACPDYGTDFIEIRDDEGVVLDHAEALCGGGALDGVIRDTKNRFTQTIDEATE